MGDEKPAAEPTADSAAKALEVEIEKKISDICGMVRVEGLMTWSQQQMLEKLDDPFAKNLVEVIHEMDPTKRIWPKIIKKMVKQKS